MLMYRFSLKLGRDPFLLRDQIMQGQLLAQKCRIRFGEFQSTEKAQAAHAKDVAALRQLEFTLPVQKCVNAVAQHRTQARPVKSLTQQVFARAGLASRYMRPCDQVAA